MKTLSVTLLFAILTACGTATSPSNAQDGAGTPQANEPTANAAPAQQNAPTAIQPAPEPTVTAQQQPQEPNVAIAQEPNTVASNPNTVPTPEVTNNPNHLQINPVTGKYDFRYGTWTNGLAKPLLPSDAPCGGIHGGAIKLEANGSTYTVVGSPVTFSAAGSISWVWSNGNVETWDADGSGTYLFADQNVSCVLKITP